MVRYEVYNQDIEDSLNYVSKIYEWSRRKHSSSQVKLPLLIGGWAVDAYNPWYGSLDIDIITNGRTRNSLKNFMKNQEGFQTEEILPKQKTISKITPEGKKIVIDYVQTKMSFEGKSDHILVSSEYIKEPQEKLLRRRIEVLVPEITALLVYKMKAAWDRNYRLDHHLSKDIEWENGKLIKDYCDIAALLDAPEPIDPAVVTDCFSDFPFLSEVISCLSMNPSLYQDYGQTRELQTEKISRNLGKIRSIFNG